MRLAEQLRKKSVNFKISIPGDLNVLIKENLLILVSRAGLSGYNLSLF